MNKIKLKRSGFGMSQVIMNDINIFLSLIKDKNNTEWILKSIIQNPCVMVVFKYKSLAERAKYDYIEMTKGLNRESSNEFPEFLSLEQSMHESIDMGRPIIFDNSCFL